ncbi:hypothetical protein JL_213 [Bacillus phage JL]|uniref:Uncharacterized protein n=1 Tax=Bacillus phage JL TaxID=1296655 RepID=S5MSV6_9CAUD|nr:hypothetical protein AVV47_gp083 [Bacillus phage JL]AGR46877.1 hypothetical protein JL_213 [Bacillus phage JL]
MNTVKDSKLKRVLELRHMIEETKKNETEMSKELSALEKELYMECEHERMTRVSDWERVDTSTELVFMKANYKCDECGHIESIMGRADSNVGINK